MMFLKKAQAARAAHLASTDISRRPNPDQVMRDVNDSSSADANSTKPSLPQAPEAGQADRPTQSTASANPHTATDGSTQYQRQAWEHVDEVLQVLKTSFPLLMLSLETMIDQIQHKFKQTPEEDVYRIICMLLQDAVQACLFEQWTSTNTDYKFY